MENSMIEEPERFDGPPSLCPCGCGEAYPDLCSSACLCGCGAMDAEPCKVYPSGRDGVVPVESRPGRKSSPRVYLSRKSA